MNLLFKRFNKIISGKFVILMFLVFMFAYILVNIIFSPYFLSKTNGNIYLESLIFYTPNDLYHLLGAYGELGRTFYFKSSLIMDFIFPLQYSLFFSSLSIFLLKKLNDNTKWQKVIFISGLILCLSDWFENIFLLITLKNYPEMMFSLSIVAITMTLLKSILTILFLVIILFFLFWIVAKFTKKNIHMRSK